MFGRDRVIGVEAFRVVDVWEVKIYSTPLDGVVRVVQYCNGAEQWSGLRRREVTEVEMQQMGHYHGRFIDDDGYERVKGQVQFTQRGPKMWIEFHNLDPDDWMNPSFNVRDCFELSDWDGDLNYGRAYMNRRVTGDLLRTYPPE